MPLPSIYICIYAFDVICYDLSMAILSMETDRTGVAAGSRDRGDETNLNIILSI